ncbi:hypothetical protein VTL71DRAFT_3231 [Oculimacula yallundae]|uniref:Uncharacterized protein n=1 Tax=Oculimacula yallundae TaxID=86028 RepID=A0ABR4C6K1_9HELO
MGHHQAKRPYEGTRASSQSSITSYFTHATPSDTSRQQLYSLPPNTSLPTTNNTPSLPHSIQSNLLNVGMRVRKSVPEGYKTGSYSAFTLFADNTTPSSNTNTPTSAMPDSSSPPALKTRPRAGNRELTPFCGILTVGGMAAQQWGIYNPNGGEMDEDLSEEDEVPFLSSQGSTISSSSLDDKYTPGGNKRRFFDDEDVNFNLDSNASSNFNSNGFMNFSPNLGERVLAVPRRKNTAGKAPARTAGQVRIFGQENFNVGRSGNGNGEDFEDAEFLDYGLAGEVEMSGCN